MTDVVYITSSSYSGSTLLTFLLNAHPDVTTIGELKGAAKDPRTHLCSCGAPVGECRFWTRLLPRLHARNVPFKHEDVWSQCGFRIPGSGWADRIVRARYRGRQWEWVRDLLIFLSPTCRRELPRIYRTNEAFVEEALAVMKARVFVDSSKDPIRLAFLRRVPSFRLKVIHMVRDGRGVMNSFLRRTQLPAEIIAREWVARQVEIGELLARFDPTAKMQLRYEDLCADPKGKMAEVFTFLGLDPAAATFDFRQVEHHVLGNAMRFSDSSEIKLDTKWYTDLSARNREVFARIAGATNAAFGYSPAVPECPEPVLTGAA